MLIEAACFLSKQQHHYQSHTKLFSLNYRAIMHKNYPALIPLSLSLGIKSLKEKNDISFSYCPIYLAQDEILQFPCLRYPQTFVCVPAHPKTVSLSPLFHMVINEWPSPQKSRIMKRPRRTFAPKTPQFEANCCDTIPILSRRHPGPYVAGCSGDRVRSALSRG
jgi:hypothetical protein